MFVVHSEFSVFFCQHFAAIDWLLGMCPLYDTGRSLVALDDDFTGVGVNMWFLFAVKYFFVRLSDNFTDLGICYINWLCSMYVTSRSLIDYFNGLGIVYFERGRESNFADLKSLFFITLFSYFFSLKWDSKTNLLLNSRADLYFNTLLLLDGLECIHLLKRRFLVIKARVSAALNFIFFIEFFDRSQEVNLSVLEL